MAQTSISEGSLRKDNKTKISLCTFFFSLTNAIFEIVDVRSQRFDNSVYKTIHVQTRVRAERAMKVFQTNKITAQLPYRSHRAKINLA